jgi:hypothetical protein
LIFKIEFHESKDGRLTKKWKSATENFSLSQELILCAYI